MKKTMLLMVMCLTACGSGGGVSSAASNTPTTQLSVMDAVVAAQVSGAIPVLDRSTSLLGTDADGNGVRDDIDAYINSLPDTSVQKKALRQDAVAMNEILVVDVTNPSAVTSAMNKSMAATACAFEVYPNTGGPDIQKYIINTKERFNAYMRFDRAVSGKAWGFPPKGSACVP